VTTRLAVLISGAGRTLLNLLEHIDDGTLNARVVLVIASRECLGAQHARDRGLDTHLIAGQIPADSLASLLDGAHADLALCAGYLKLVSVPDAYRGRILNIHPALLPDFGGPGMYGDRVHRAVLESGATESGCTVHAVDEAFDHGPIIVQKRCAVLPGDTAESLADRVLGLEYAAYPEAVNIVLNRLTDGNTTRCRASKHPS